MNGRPRSPTPLPWPPLFDSPAGTSNGKALRFSPAISSTSGTRASGMRPVEPSRAEGSTGRIPDALRSEEHTSELQSQSNLVCRLLLEKKKSSFDASAALDVV